MPATPQIIPAITNKSSILLILVLISANPPAEWPLKQSNVVNMVQTL